MMGREVCIPSRSDLSIVSVVPSQTELLYDMGLKSQILGQTLFCVNPKKEFDKATKIGGTKKLNIDKIINLNPDVIIANKEENSREQIERLSEYFPVWVSDIETLEDNYLFIREMGNLFDKQSKALEINNQIKEEFKQLSSFGVENVPVVYLIWNDPIMSAGQGTFINYMLQMAGYNNLVQSMRYPEMNIEEIKTLQPKILMLSSEPFPFKAKHIAYFQQICPKAVIQLVDGELFSWYGSRMMFAVPYFIKLRKEIRAKQFH